MTRDHAIAHLKAFAQTEHRLSQNGYTFMPRSERQSARDRHRQNALALDVVLAEIEGASLDCPTPYRQGDEQYCSRCGVRWGVDEEKPECLSK